MSETIKTRRETILDSAETLFAEDGYHAVTLRKIARQSHVDMALLNYHFRNKILLLEAVIQRRANEISDERNQLIEQIRKDSDGNPLDIKRVIDAYLFPMLNRASRNESWANYMQVLAGAASVKQLAPLISKLYDPVANLFISAIHDALPGISDEDSYWYYQFMLGAMIAVMAKTGRLNYLSGGKCQSEDLSTAAEKLAVFLHQGFAGKA